MCAAAKGQCRKGRGDSLVITSKLVRILAIAVAGLVTLSPLGARADQREDLQSKGEQQAKDGRFADAIESFKAADRIQPRASHACLIALAYTRRELWSQAQLWLSTCHDRASASDPLPDWVPLAETQIKERLQTANVAEVTIEVKPAGVKAKFTVSSFAPDEVFEPRTVTLPFGTHVIFVKLDGVDGPGKQATVELKDKSPQTVVLDFGDVQVAPPIDHGNGGSIVGPGPSGPRDSAPNNTLSTGLLITGGVAIIAGGISHIVMSGARKDMIAATDQFEAGTLSLTDANGKYDDAEGRFERARIGAVTLYIVGAGLAVTGYLIRKKHGPESATVSAMPLPEGGGLVSVGWIR